MHQQDKLSRQETRLNPIQSVIAPVGEGGKPKPQSIYDSITNANQVAAL